MIKMNILKKFLKKKYLESIKLMKIKIMIFFYILLITIHKPNTSLNLIIKKEIKNKKTLDKS